MSVLSDAIFNFLNTHITYEIIIYFIAAFFTYLSYKKEFVVVYKILRTILAIMTLILITVLAIYLLPKIFP